MYFKSIALIVASAFLAACNIMPYENEFGCKMPDNYGKCGSVEDAYKEAVTGIPQGKLIKPASKGGSSITATGDSHDESAHEHPNHIEAPYPSYRNSVYEELSTLIEQPQTPMLKSAKTIRTLVLSYSPSNQKRILYMPRYVYSIIDQPEWVLGQYLNKKPELLKSILEGAN